MLLFLVRHGDVSEFAVDDDHRGLSVQGETQAGIVGKAMQTLDIHVDGVLSSPLLRAYQTASIIQTELDIPIHKTTEYLTPESNPKQIISLINDSGYESLLLVGHEPNLRGLSSLLFTGMTKTNILFKKANLACISSPKPISPGTGTFHWLLTNEQLEFIALK